MRKFNEEWWLDDEENEEYDDSEFDSWYDNVLGIIIRKGYNKLDRDTAREDFQEGLTPEESAQRFIDDWEDAPKSTKSEDTKSYSIEEIEKIIDCPTENWKGNCYGVAVNCVEKGVVKGKVRYGHYKGYISPNSLFAYRIGLPLGHHAWIELPNGQIYDPTRWVFENKKPYIYIGNNNGEYSVGERFFKTPPPPFNKSAKLITVNFDLNTMNFVKTLLKDDRMENSDTFTINQIVWLANESVSTLGEFAKPIYKELERLSLGAFVPIDNWNLVMERIKKFGNF